MARAARPSEGGVAALVVMRPASGLGLEQVGLATTETVGGRLPAPAEAERARRFFSDQGFEAGPLVGIAFSIASDRGLMEKWLPGFDRLEGSGGELPLDRLPEELRENIAAIVTEAPPELHP